MGDPISGGSVYWLTDTVDGGDLAAQDWLFVNRQETATELWRYRLLPLGVELFKRVLKELDAGRLVAVPQDEDYATWESSWNRKPLHRPDLLMLGSGLEGFAVTRDQYSLRPHA
jgi:methionyl-tRNA formyltransferase